jgi:hypothetical protein
MYTKILFLASILNLSHSMAVDLQPRSVNLTEQALTWQSCYQGDRNFGGHDAELKACFESLYSLSTKYHPSFWS